MFPMHFAVCDLDHFLKSSGNLKLEVCTLFLHIDYCERKLVVGTVQYIQLWEFRFDSRPGRRHHRGLQLNLRCSVARLRHLLYPFPFKVEAQ